MDKIERKLRFFCREGRILSWRLPRGFISWRQLLLWLY